MFEAIMIQIYLIRDSWFIKNASKYFLLLTTIRLLIVDAINDFKLTAVTIYSLYN